MTIIIAGKNAAIFFGKYFIIEHIFINTVNCPVCSSVDHYLRITFRKNDVVFFYLWVLMSQSIIVQIFGQTGGQTDRQEDWAQEWDKM